MRNCDPGTDDRLPIDRASRCWNDDFEFDCNWQSTGLHAPGWLSVRLHDSVRRSPSVDGVEPQNGYESPVAKATPGNCPWPCGSARHRLLKWPSSYTRADSGTTDTQQAVHPFGLVCASGRIAPSFVLFRSNLFLRVPIGIPRLEDANQSGVRPTTGNVMTRTCLRNGLRTHSLTRVSNEKRNVDECPSTGGKSNCHR